MNNPSKDQLAKSLDRRVRHLMIQTLQRFESSFPDKDNTREGHIFKGDLRTMFNDALRAQRDELNDYEIEYRPLRITNENMLAMTATFLQSVQQVEFDDHPSIRFYAAKDRKPILDALRDELGVGIVHPVNDQLVLEVCGTHDCVSSVLLVMDRYRLHAEVRAKYQQWRSKVVRLYQGVR